MLNQFRGVRLLPPEATLEVRLEDVSDDTAVKPIAATDQILLGGSPYTFVLDYDVKRISLRRQYAQPMASGHCDCMATGHDPSKSIHPPF
ncbi:MAG: YbaY family lipoprotein [Halioglobus sp.]|nr:YbaY family lipoprotein [Halioglobus sp.]